VVVRRACSHIFRILYLLCFILMLLCSLALCGWLLLASMDMGWPVPRIIIYMICLLVAQIISLILYFKWPLVAVLAAWIDMLLIMVGVVPRNSTSWNSFFYQFMFNIIFWAAANGGYAAYFALNRRRLVQGRVAQA
jgi:hypothetical protein